MKRDLEASLIEKYAAIEPVLNERGRRPWAAAESEPLVVMKAMLLCHLPPVSG